MGKIIVNGSQSQTSTSSSIDPSTQQHILRVNPEVIFDYIDQGSSAGVQQMLRATCSTEIQKHGDYGKTPLAYAAKRLQTSIMRVLLEAGATIHTDKIYSSEDPMFFFRKNESEEAVMLLAQYCPINNNPLRGALTAIWVAQGGSVEAMKLVVSRGAELSLRSGDGSTVLMIAAMFGHKDLVEWLVLQQELGVDEQDKQGQTALMLAAGGLYLDTVQSLVNLGAQTDLVNKENETLLHYAASGAVAEYTYVPEDEIQSRQYDVLKYLINLRDDRLTQDIHGQVPLAHLAWLDKRCVSMLMCEGIDLHKTSKKNETIFMVACGHASYEIIEDLIKQVDSIRIEIEKNEIILRILSNIRLSDQEIIALIKILLKKNAKIPDLKKAMRLLDQADLLRRDRQETHKDLIQFIEKKQSGCTLL